MYPTDNNNPEIPAISANLASQDQDWIIPGDPSLGTDGMDDFEDFIIGQELIVDFQGDFATKGSPADFENMEEVLFQDLHGMVNEIPLGKNSDISSDESALADWNDLPQGHGAIVGEAASPVEEGRESFQQEALALQEIERLNRRIFRDCQGLLEIYPSKDALSIDEVETLRSKLILDRDLIDEHTEKVQSLINRSILRGDLEEMRHYNQVKAALSETHFLLRRLSKQMFPTDLEGLEQGDTRSSDGDIDVRNVDVFEVPEISHARFDVPIRRQKEKRRGKHVPEEPLAARFTPSKRLFSLALLIFLFLMIPASYYLSARRGMAKRINLDPYEFSTIIPLEEVYKIQGNFIGKVKENWVTLSDKEKRNQVNDLLNVIGRDNYKMVALYYPDGKPSANFILGNVIIY